MHPLVLCHCMEELNSSEAKGGCPVGARLHSGTLSVLIIGKDDLTAVFTILEKWKSLC